MLSFLLDLGLVFIALRHRFKNIDLIVFIIIIDLASIVLRYLYLVNLDF